MLGVFYFFEAKPTHWVVSGIDSVAVFVECVVARSKTVKDSGDETGFVEKPGGELGCGGGRLNGRFLTCFKLVETLDPTLTVAQRDLF